MEIKLYQYGALLCSFEGQVIRDILRADSSPGQEEEYRRVMDILLGFSEGRVESAGHGENCTEIDLGKVLSDGIITAEKTLSLPILLAAVRQCGASSGLLPEILHTMTVYANMQAAVMEIHYRSLVNLKRLSETVCEALYGMDESGDDFYADRAAEDIIAVLPEEALSLDNKCDLRLLAGTVRGIESIMARCLDNGNIERLEEFVQSVKPLTERLRGPEERENDEKEANGDKSEI